MNDISPFGSASDLLADDLLLDRIAARADAGTEPVAGLLAALAAHADTPLPARTGRRRIANKHRYLGAFAVLAVAASGAGVAAAVTLPHEGSLLADRARIEQRMEQSARSGAPSALLSRLGLPATDGTTTARGLVLARGADGTFVLLPAAAAAPSRTPARVGGPAGEAGDGVGAVGVAGSVGGSGGGAAGGGSASNAPVAAPAGGRDKAPKDKATKPAKTRPGTTTGNGRAGTEPGANGQTGDATTGKAASDPVWVLDPSTGTTDTTGTTTDPTTVPSDTTVTGPAPVAGRLGAPTNQPSLVGPPTSPQPGHRTLPSEGLPPAVAAHPVGATPALPATPATPATGVSPASPAIPATPPTPPTRLPDAAAVAVASAL